MTDDDFDKVDEDFASEFDFVDNKEAGPSASSGQTSSPQQPQQPKGSPAIVTLMVLISVLGAGYYAYNKFFAKKSSEIPAVTPPPAAPAEPGAMPGTEGLPTLPEHSPDTMQPATSDSSVPASPNAVAEQLGKPTPEDMSAALPPTTSGERTFEQLQKDLQSKQAAPAQTAQPVVPQEIRNALQTISEEMTENVNNIRQLEGTIANIDSTLDQLNRTISAMDNRILALTETVNGLSDDLTNVKRVMIEQDLDLTMPGNVKISSSSKKQVKSINSTEPNYTVHAIIPGRAWLKSANGQIITVTEGDKIGDYGTVAVIDAANGLIRTSSGIIIR